MICERCKENPATVHLTKIEHKKKREFHLCEDCAKQQGITSIKGGFSVQSFLDEVAESSEAAASTLEAAPPCPACGLSFSTFRTTGRLGCPDDYEHFKESLTPLIEKIHDSSQHVGKIPKRLTERLERRKLIACLKQEQDRAISEENYEKAADLRDRIHQLEEEMGSSASST